jgi:hypothetical protein
LQLLSGLYTISWCLFSNSLTPFIFPIWLDDCSA